MRPRLCSGDETRDTALTCLLSTRAFDGRGENPGQTTKDQNMSAKLCSETLRLIEIQSSARKMGLEAGLFDRVCSADRRDCVDHHLKVTRWGRSEQGSVTHDCVIFV